MHCLLRWMSICVLAGVWLRPAAPGDVLPEPSMQAPPLLEDAFGKLMENQGRWAYTETHAVVGLTGKPKGPTVLKVDPSRPYTEQYKPLQIEGEAPTQRDLEDFQGIGERVATRRKRDQQESGEHRGDELKMRLNFQVVTPDLVHATVVGEDKESITYNVPLRAKGAAGASAFDKFRVTARVSKQRREFEHATIRQQAPMRVAFIATVAGAVIDFDFTSVDPQFPAVITRGTQQADVSIMFIKRRVSFGMKRGDFRHVTPYDERFGVKFGPIRTIEF